MKCIILDDELMARKFMERLVSKHPALELVASFESPTEALKFLETEKPDLIFLDVEMPEMTGTEFLDKSPMLPLVIFTTSNVDYAFDAFEYHAVDFLKKPIAQPRFEQAVAKALEKAKQNAEFRRNADAIFVRENSRYVRVQCDDILFFENVGDYVRIKTAAGQHIIHGTLKSIEERLDDPRFQKVHRTYIVNLSKIKDIEEGSLTIEKHVIPISRMHRAELMARLKVL